MINKLRGIEGNAVRDENPQIARLSDLNPVVPTSSRKEYQTQRYQELKERYAKYYQDHKEELKEYYRQRYIKLHPNTKPRQLLSDEEKKKRRGINSLRYKHSEKGKITQDKYYRSDSKKQSSRSWHERNQDKKECYRVFRKALRSGTLIKQNCVYCDSDKSFGHHEDYSKPLDVIWMCLVHHNKYHWGTIYAPNEIKGLTI